jgi:RimJ/RimL family protein N-acetyltransferase
VGDIKHLKTNRLTLIAANAEYISTELKTPERLSNLLDAYVSADWPTGEYDRHAMEFFLARFEEGGEKVEGWYSWYAICEKNLSAQKALVGAGGYFGPPTADGMVEIGYSVLPEWQKQGYASEMVKGLVDHAFAFPEIKQVVAHTTKANPASIKVLLKGEFYESGPGTEPDTLRFVRYRSDHVQQGASVDAQGRC